MLSLGKVDEIRLLLAAGLSQREVARQARVSRQTVAKVLHGRDRYAAENSGLLVTPAQSKRIIARARAAGSRKTPESIRELFAGHAPAKLELGTEFEARYLALRARLRAEGKPGPDDADDSSEAA